MKKNIYFDVILPITNILEKKRITFFENFDLFKPAYYTLDFGVKNIKYSEEKIQNSIVKEIKSKKEERNISIIEGEDYGGENSIDIYIHETNLIISGFLEEKVFLLNKKKLIDRIDRTLKKMNGVQAHIVSVDDDHWQNVKYLDEYIKKNRSTENIFMKPVLEDEDIEIDTEKNLGHSHIENEMNFGAFYMMWFGSEFFKYVKEEGFIKIKDCYENVEIGNGIRRITLYEDIYDYENPENRRRQRVFLETTGIDEVAHKFKKIREDKKKEEFEMTGPTTEIYEINKDEREIRSYLNEKGELATKEQATLVRIAKGKSNGTGTVEIIEKREDD